MENSRKLPIDEGTSKSCTFDNFNIKIQGYADYYDYYYIIILKFKFV